MTKRTSKYFRKESGADMADKNMSGEVVKEIVKEAYSAVARGERAGAGCGSSCCGSGQAAPVCYASSPDEVAVAIGYNAEELAALPDGANMGLGCGNPGAIASLAPGEVVLDLGSGGGVDCFLAAAKVGRTGKVIGVDMTPDMIELANKNLSISDYENIEFRLGEIENLPVEDNSIDVVISNCVINLVPNKERAFQEIHRVLKPGGRIAVSDIVKLRDLPPAIENDPATLSACISGSLLREDYLEAIWRSGLSGVRIVSSEDFGPMFFATDGPVSGNIRESFPDGHFEGYIASIKVAALKPVRCGGCQ
jgi:arsenite methyltransferase